MSTKPVPDTASRSIQVADITSVRRCSAPFQNLRGKVGGDLLNFIDDCLDQPDPNCATRMWRERMNNLGVMLGTCAMLRGAGKGFAEMELKRALVDPDYILAGETVPSAETTPFTVFAVDPDATFRMDKLFRDWWKPFPEESYDGVVPPDFWERYQDEAFCKERYGDVLWPMFKEIDWDLVHGRGSWHGDRPSPRAIFRTVVAMFGHRIVDINTRRVGERTMEFSPWGFSRRWLKSHYAKLAGNSRHFSSMSCVFGKAVGQSELLGAFSPADQERLATWELRLPTAMVGNKHVYTVCVRPEAEHAHWRLVRPQFTSNVAHGHFVTVTPIAWRDRVFAGEELHRLRLYQNSQVFR